MNYEEARAFAAGREKEIPCDRFTQVDVVHQDGSKWHFTYGLIEEYGKFVAVFSEHHHPEVWFKGDLASWGYTANASVDDGVDCCGCE